MNQSIFCRRCGLAVLAVVMGLSATLAQGQTLSTLMYFNGSREAGGLTFGNDGALYGVTTESTFFGGAVGGLIYRLPVPPGDTGPVSTLYQYGIQGNFTGGGPHGYLAIDAGGNLYGVTGYNSVDLINGLRSGYGTIFRVSSRDPSTYTQLHVFATPADITTTPWINDDGILPIASILLASDGFLYGTTTAGGANGTGTIFRIATDGSSFEVLHHFDASSTNNGDSRPINSDGDQALSRLTLASNGDLYGTTTYGGVNGTGVIFRLHPDGSSYSVIFNFDVSPPPDPTWATLQTNSTGAYPMSGLLDGNNGFLYGTTQLQGANGYGNIYRIAFDGTGFTVLQSFVLASGANPQGELILANDGTVVGTTSTGGLQADGVTSGLGTLYSMTLDGGVKSTLYVFGTDGAAPTTGVIQASDGSFFGTTSSAGIFGQGTVYKFGAATNVVAQGTPVPVHSGALSDWFIAIALLLLSARLVNRRPQPRLQRISLPKPSQRQ